jgi:hypothetical protein
MKIQTCLQRLKDANYDVEEVIDGYANMEALRKERMELDEERTFEARFATVKDVLPLAEQITQLKMGICELLAFHSAVYEKADMERIPLDTVAYKIVEDIQHYSQLGGLKKEQDRPQQQIFMSNMIMTTRQQALVSLMRLQALGVSDMEIKNVARVMEFDSILSLKEKNNGNTNNNGWPKLSTTGSQLSTVHRVEA